MTEAKEIFVQDVFTYENYGEYLDKVEQTMILQDRLNSTSFKGEQDWKDTTTPYYRAAWIECAEMVDHLGWKWWKHQTPDQEQANMELVDIYHFIISEVIRDGLARQDVLLEYFYVDKKAMEIKQYSKEQIFEETEKLVVSLIQRETKKSLSSFFTIMVAMGLEINDLLFDYLGKNTLNFFRQDNGYADGSYVKIWEQAFKREDNYYLVKILNKLKGSIEKIEPSEISDRIYEKLDDKYQELVIDPGTYTLNDES